MKQFRLPIGVLLAISLVWGSTWIANAMLPEPAAPRRATMVRYLLAWLLLAAAECSRVLWRRIASPPGQSLSQPATAEASGPATVRPLPAHTNAPHFAIPGALDLPANDKWRWIGVSMLLGATMFAAPELLSITADGRGVAAWTPLIYAGLPLGLLLAAGELRIPAILGLGAMLVLLNGSLPLIPGRLAWVLLIVGAMALQGWSLIYARRHLAVASSLRGVMVQIMTAFWLLNLSEQLWPEPAADLPPSRWPASSLEAMAALALLATSIAYPLYYRLLARFEPAQLAVSAWLQTLVAVGESAILLRQRPGWPMIGAAVILIGCATLLLRREDGGGNPAPVSLRSDGLHRSP
jgi:drug/metabolite transporter (DMT)-like permease